VRTFVKNMWPLSSVLRMALGFREVLEYPSTKLHGFILRTIVILLIIVVKSVVRSLFNRGRGEGIKMIVVFRLNKTECV
jgi:hypothetical protein